MRRVISVCIACALLALVGCSKKTTPENAKSTNLLQKLQKDVTDLQGQMMDNALAHYELESKINAFKEASIDPTQKGYCRLDSNNGTFLLSCEKVQPYLDGYQVSLLVGNPYAVSFVGFKLAVTWGPEWNSKTQQYPAWQANLHKKEIEFADELRAASWNRVKLILTPATPSELAYLVVTMQTDTVSMRRASGQQ